MACLQTAMRILLATLNAKFIHSAPALYYLKNSARWYCTENGHQIEIAEFNINQPAEFVAGEIFRHAPDLLALSCYIWNIKETREVIRRLRPVLPHTHILLGGPEVSFESAEILSANPEVDFIIAGEGEYSFPSLLAALDGKVALAEVPGLYFRSAGKILEGRPPAPVLNLDHLPPLYTPEDLAGLQDKIVYYETSRGCPFRCQYCLSAVSPGVRYFSLERVKKDLTSILNAGIKQLKFVDRTFNCRRDRAQAIWRFLLETAPPDCSFHFEIAADLLTDEDLRFLQQVPPGLFAFEIGVQSTNEQTLAAVQRRTNLEILTDRVTKLAQMGNIHLHLDLIAGLPYEDYASFSRSFDAVYRMGGHHLQLGFLKGLKGSGLRRDAAKFGLVFAPDPPYEILSTPHLSHAELLRLKTIEDLLEKYGNSHRFTFALQFLWHHYYPSPFRFFEEFALFWEGRGYHLAAHKTAKLFAILAEFFETKTTNGAQSGSSSVPPREVFREVLKLDYLLWEQGANLPAWAEPFVLPGLSQLFHELLHNRTFLSSFPKLAALSPREAARQSRLEAFRYDVLAIAAYPAPTPETTTPSREKIFEPVRVFISYADRNPVTGLPEIRKVGKGSGA